MIHISSEIEKRLMMKRSDDDVVATLSMPEHKFKKISDKFNDVILDVYNEYKDSGVKMTDILLDLRAHFEIEYMVAKLLNKKIKTIVKKEYTDLGTQNDTKNNNK